jgi:hypothetical protein
MNTKILKGILGLLLFSIPILLVEQAKAQSIVETLSLYDLTIESLIQIDSGGTDANAFEALDGLNQSGSEVYLGISQVDSEPITDVEKPTMSNVNVVVSEPSENALFDLGLGMLIAGWSQFRPRPRLTFRRPSLAPKLPCKSIKISSAVALRRFGQLLKSRKESGVNNRE